MLRLAHVVDVPEGSAEDGEVSIVASVVGLDDRLLGGIYTRLALDSLVSILCATYLRFRYVRILGRRDTAGPRRM